MFNKTGPNSVESSEGFEVARIGRLELKYTEGERSIIIDVEPGDGLAIYSSSIKRWGLDRMGNLLSEDERNKVARNVCDALKFMGVKFDYI